MPRIAYVNGFYVRHDMAFVHVEDRGYQFADGVYEVCAVVGGKILDYDGHWARFERSLDALSIPVPLSQAAFRTVIAQMIARNHLRDGIIYWQATRGVAARDHAITSTPRPALVVTARRLNFKAKADLARKGVAVISTRDERWGRCDIKSVSLLGNVLAKEKARQAGAYEAWMVKGEKVSEGGSTNTWIVDKDGVLRTHPLNHAILGGITRDTVLKLARDLGVKVEERAFSLAEAHEAREAFITSSTNFVMPVTSIDDRPIANGAPGLLTSKLVDAYWRYVEAQTGAKYQ